MSRPRQPRLSDHAAVAYLRDGVPGLTLAKQELALTRAGVSLDGACRDILNPTQLQRREARSLKQRAQLLDSEAFPSASPGSPSRVIHVAALRCLGWNVADVARALAAVSRMGAAVHLVDTGETLTPAMLHAGVLDALAGLDETWRRGQTEEGRSAAAVAIASKAEAARRARIEAARPLWARPPEEIGGAEIAARVGLSLRTLNKWLGPRRKGRRPGQQAVGQQSGEV